MEKLTLNREDEEYCTYIYRYDIERERERESSYKNIHLN